MSAEILVLGVIISIIFYELTNISPGGIIVPGIMVLYINNPLRMVYTLGIAILAYYIVKLLSMRFIIFGKRKFALLIILSFILHLFFNLIFGAAINDLTAPVISLVGYTISGIIASNMSKQGVIKTSCALAVVIGILELLLLIFQTTGVVTV